MIKERLLLNDTQIKVLDTILKMVEEGCIKGYEPEDKEFVEQLIADLNMVAVEGPNS